MALHALMSDATRADEVGACTDWEVSWFVVLNVVLAYHNGQIKVKQALQRGLEGDPHLKICGNSIIPISRDLVAFIAVDR
ncbi:MAG: hypothetical protein ACJAVO_001633 [Parvibaculaceae bacterium]|jgi:hypothetical protein